MVFETCLFVRMGKFFLTYLLITFNIKSLVASTFLLTFASSI